MPLISTSALVLRRADYSDYDRMATLFSPRLGRVDCIARGCKRPKSPLMNACEPFVSGEFQLYQKGERFTMEQCSISESFFPLRTDYDRLRHGVYWLKLLENCVMPDVPMENLFLISLQALAHLSYSDFPLPMLTMAFEMHLMAQLGYAPRVDACQICGRAIDGDARFDVRRGGCVCLHCASCAPYITNGARRVMLKLPRTRFEAVKHLEGYPDWPEAARLFRGYVLDRLALPPIAPEME